MPTWRLQPSLADQSPGASKRTRVLAICPPRCVNATGRLHSTRQPMGIYDRDYYRRPTPTAVGRMQMWSITTWLIVINVAVFIIDPLIFQNGDGVRTTELVRVSQTTVREVALPP